MDNEHPLHIEPLSSLGPGIFCVLSFFSSCFVTVPGHAITFCDRNDCKIGSSVSMTKHEILDMLGGFDS